MTSVTCSACALKITSESDRVYCFGGCEQILHVRCSELNTSGATAARENGALKYLCFGCRKQLTCLNDIQKKCTELMERMNAVDKLMAKQEAVFVGFGDNICLKIEERILPRILAAIDEKKMPVQNCTPHTLPPNRTYASVTYSSAGTSSAEMSKKRAINDIDCNVNANTNVPVLQDEGGLLRSGKRRRLVMQSGISTAQIVAGSPSAESMKKKMLLNSQLHPGSLEQLRKWRKPWL